MKTGIVTYVIDLLFHTLLVAARTWRMVTLQCYAGKISPNLPLDDAHLDYPFIYNKITQRSMLRKI